MKRKGRGRKRTERKTENRKKRRKETEIKVRHEKNKISYEACFQERKKILRK